MVLPTRHPEEARKRDEGSGWQGANGCGTVLEVRFLEVSLRRKWLLTSQLVDLALNSSKEFGNFACIHSEFFVFKAHLSKYTFIIKIMNELRKRIAIVDTGSNTIRLAVFDCTRDAASDPSPLALKFPDAALSQALDKQNDSAWKISPIVDIKNTAGLANYVKDGVFSQEGVEKAASVLLEHLECAKNLHCDETYIFATAVLRNAENSQEAVSSIERKVLKKIELLSGEEEASLGLYGAFYRTDVTKGMLIDLGGGSCEITKFGEGGIQMESLMMGCVSAYSQMVSGILPTKKECDKIKRAIDDRLEKTEIKLGKQANVWGIGGSVRAIAKFTREMKNLAKTPKHVRSSDIADMMEFLKKDENTFAHVAVRSVPDRIHSVVPGCIIVSEILKKTNAKQLDICKTGLREGFLLQKLIPNPWSLAL